MKVINVVALSLLISSVLSCADGSADATSQTTFNVATHDGVAGNKSAPISITNATNNTNTLLSNVSNSGLNPAHGQPGHRCDIPVGQPLNSQPIKRFIFNPLSIGSNAGIKPQVTSANRVINRAANSNTYLPVSGLNPPHGMPGHRCDIPVGQPLNSKPPVATSTTNTINVAPGMNPPHGMPNHRCDIPVGQPLNSKPVQKSLPATTAAAANIASTATNDSIKGQ